MTRVNLDMTALTDPRFGRLASLLGLADADHARGRMVHVWMACTMRGSTTLPQWLVDQLLGAGGADALIDSELASWSAGRGDSDTRGVLIAGADRCLWYVKLTERNREQSSKGGKARAQTPARRAGRFAASTSPAGWSATSPSYSGSYSGSGSSTEDPEPPYVPPAGGDGPDRPAKPKGKRKATTDATPAELASVRVVLDRLSTASGVAYTGSQPHVALILARLREGLSELDLRAVVRYCADQWRDKPEMAPYLRPATLFGPQKIHDYLEPARAYCARELAELAPQRSLELVAGGKP